MRFEWKRFGFEYYKEISEFTHHWTDKNASLLPHLHKDVMVRDDKTFVMKLKVCFNSPAYINSAKMSSSHTPIKVGKGRKHQMSIQVQKSTRKPRQTVVPYLCWTGGWYLLELFAGLPEHDVFCADLRIQEVLNKQKTNQTHMEVKNRRAESQGAAVKVLVRKTGNPSGGSKSRYLTVK